MLLGKYNQSKTVRFRLFQVDGVDFESAATFAAGDVKIMKDEGVEANTTNLPTDEGQGYSLVLTATEMSAARIEIYIVDQTATKVWLDTGLSIETYGNASAEHAFDLDTASTAQTADHTAAIADIPTVAEFNARTLVAADYFDPTADTVAAVTTVASVSGSVGSVTGSVGSVTGAVGSVTAQVSADVTAISGDTTAANNLEATYDGTGYSDDAAPATQAQVGNISSGTAAQGQNATGFVLTTGIETLTYTSTTAADGVLHEIAPSGGNTDGYYTTTLPGNSAVTSVRWTGYAQGNADTVELQFYDWVAVGYVTEKTLVGSNGATLTEEEIPAVNSYVGTGANVGEVRFRILSTTSTNIATDRLIFSYTTVAAESGFENGRVWVDTIGGVAGTASGIGIATNPVLTIGDAITIAANNNLRQFAFPSDSTLIPTGDFNDYSVYGVRYGTTLGGHDYSGSLLSQSSPVEGIATTATLDPLVMLECLIGTMTCDNAYFMDSVFTDTYTFGTSGIVSPLVSMIECKSGIPGAGSPVFTKTPGATLSWAVRGWKGSMTVNGLEAGDVVTIGGTELGAITLNGADAAVEIRGIAKTIVDNLTGSPTVNLDGVVVASDVADILVDTAEIGTAGAGLTDLGGMSTGMKAEVNAEADTALTDYDGPTNTEFEARTPTAAQLAYIVRHAATALPVTFSGTGTTTTGTMALVDGATPSAINDAYNGRVLVFNLGTLDEQVTDITGYNGTTKEVTVTAVTTAITSSHTAVMV